MKQKFYLLLALCLFMGSLHAFAQGQIQFDTETHDFGNVAEGVTASYEFRFKNTGNQPLIISNVQASCGCTTPEWTKDPVLPGKTGIIKAAYNSAGRPGSFNKSITVTSNAATPTKILFIKGMVVKPEDIKKEYSAAEKAQSPRLALSGTNHSFGKIERNRPVTAKFTIKNTGKQNLNITGIQSACNCVDFRLTPSSVKPNQEATLELIYTPRTLGERTETITIHSNDIVSQEIKVSLKANTVESLASPSMLKEGASAVPFR